MTDFLRILLLLVLAGAVVTGAAAWLAWWNEEVRRITRVIERALAGPADAQIIARGQNAAVAFSLDAEQVLVLREGGARALLYPMTALLGAELIVDGAVVARVHRGEPRRAMDMVKPAAREVTLRLLFDNPRDPDVELDLGPGAVQEARTWLARAEAITRMSPATPAVQARAPADVEVEDEDEAPF
jgi:hypothetical protein